MFCLVSWSLCTLARNFMDRFESLPENHKVRQRLQRTTDVPTCQVPVRRFGELRNHVRDFFHQSQPPFPSRTPQCNTVPAVRQRLAGSCAPFLGLEGYGSASMRRTKLLAVASVTPAPAKEGWNTIANV